MCAPLIHNGTHRELRALFLWLARNLIYSFLVNEQGWNTLEIKVKIERQNY